MGYTVLAGMAGRKAWLWGIKNASVSFLASDYLLVTYFKEDCF